MSEWEENETSETEEEQMEEVTEENPNEKKHGKYFPVCMFFTGALIAVILTVGIGHWIKAYKTAHFEAVGDDKNRVVSESLESKLQAIRDVIGQNFLFDYADADFDAAILKGYVNALGDPYSVYYSQEEYEELEESLSGIYQGVGIVVQQNAETKTITVVRLIKNSPAEQAGIQKGDIIAKVEGVEVGTEELDLVVSKIRGEAGTKVTLTMYRPSDGRYLDFTLERKELESDTVIYEMKEDKIGYISISQFDNVAADQFKKAVADLQGQGMRKLILDLRDNGGGYLQAAVDLLDPLIPRGVATYTVDKNNNQSSYYSYTDKEYDFPMVILVNENTASASEIVTGACKDYGVAKIVGTTTFGKGIVQGIFQFPDGSNIKLTISHYYTPSGTCIHETGITPDVLVEWDYESETDVQLEKALEVIKGMN